MSTKTAKSEGLRRAGDNFVAATGRPGKSAKSAGFQSAGTMRMGDHSVGNGKANDAHSMGFGKTSTDHTNEGTRLAPGRDYSGSSKDVRRKK
jgi:hypothetical protein